MKLGDYFNDLATKAGINPENEELKAFLTNPTVSGYEIGDTLAGELNNAYLTLESAKHNPALKNHFTALALAGVDDEVKNTAAALGLSTEALDAINGHKSSYKRVAELANQVKATQAAAANGDPEAEAKMQKLAQEVDTLNKAVLDAKAAKDTALAEQANQFKAQKIDWQLENLLGGKNYASQASKQANVLTAKTLLNQKINSLGLKVEETNGQLKLVNAETGQDYYQNNAPVNVAALIDETLGEHKLLAVTPKPGEPGQPAAQPGQVVTPQPVANNSAASLADKLLQELENENNN